jgi:fructokinase
MPNANLAAYRKIAPFMVRIVDRLDRRRHLGPATCAILGAMGHRFTFVGIGEALFDTFGGEQRLGGAPLNVAVQAHQLAQPRQGQGVLASRVGQDDLGQSILDRLRQRGMSTRYIQSDPDRPTGQVFVDTDAQGQPTYDIVENSAWDMLWFDSDLEDLAMTCNAVCFGTLAQREAQTRNAIYRFLDTCRRAVRVLDVNLRPPYYEPRILRRSCEKADVLKMNEDELPIVCDQVGAEAAKLADADRGAAEATGLMASQRAQADALRRKYELRMVVITRGREGTVALTGDGWHIGDKAEYPFADNATAVGAGDACVAGLMAGQVFHLSTEQTLTLANHLGAYVAASPEATPELPEPILKMVQS